MNPQKPWKATSVGVRSMVENSRAPGILCARIDHGCNLSGALNNKRQIVRLSDA